MKTFTEMENVGKAKYVVNYHDGVKQHSDGSPFFDVAIFSSRSKKDGFVKELRKSGYRAHSMDGADARQKGENILSFMDRVLWGLAARLARDAAKSMERVYLWYAPSTETQWGSVVVAENQPAGYELVTNESLPRLAAADRMKNIIYPLLRNLPIIPTSDEAFERDLET